MLQLSEERDWVIVLVRVNISIMKHHEQPGKERVYSDYTSTLLFTIKEVRTNTGQDPGGKS